MAQGLKNKLAFKFGDVVALGRIKRSTADYVLKHPDHLSGMPEGERQGRHREFSFMQAFRLTLYCRLMSYLHDMDQVRVVMAHVDKRLAELGWKLDDYLAQTKIAEGEQICLWIADRRFVCVDRLADQEAEQGPAWLDLESGQESRQRPWEDVDVLMFRLTKLYARFVRQKIVLDTPTPDDPRDVVAPPGPLNLAKVERRAE